MKSKPHKILCQFRGCKEIATTRLGNTWVEYEIKIDDNGDFMFFRFAGKARIKDHDHYFTKCFCEKHAVDFKNDGLKA